MIKIFRLFCKYLPTALAVSFSLYFINLFITEDEKVAVFVSIFTGVYYLVRAANGHINGRNEVKNEL